MADQLIDQSILVTGGGGFIGSHLSEALVPANTVVIVDNFSTGSREWIPSQATVIEGDIRNDAVLEQVLDDVDIVFHQAAQVDVSESVARPAQTHDINVTGTIEILDRVRRSNTRVVVASSTAIHGEPVSVPTVEDEPTNPTTPYGISKLAVDHYARVFDSLYDCEVIPLRYYNVYGPRQSGNEYSGVVDTFITKALAGDPLTIHGDGTQTRDFIHVHDIITANLLAATTVHTGEAYNVGTSDSVSIIELAELIIELAESDSEIVHTDQRPADIHHSKADIEKIRTRLGFEPSVPLRDGLQDLIQWYRERATLPMP